MNDKELIDLIEHDLNGAKPMHNDQISKIAEWISAYDGEPYGNEDDSRSEIVWKLIKKQGETLISNLAKPFLGAHEILDLDPLTTRDVIKSKIYGKVGNHLWSKEFQSNKFIKDICRLMVKEGTAFFRVGWEKVVEKKEVDVPAGMPEEMLSRLTDKGAKLTQNPDGSYKAVTETIIKNRATAKPLRTEDCYIDPTADSHDEMQFFAFDYVTTLSDIKSQKHLYSEAAIKKLERLIDQQSDRQDGPSESSHEYNRYSFEHTDNPRKKIRLNEYWGNFDIDGTGIAVPAMAVTAKYGEDRVLMRMEKNKLPFKKIPIISVPLVEKEFSIYGDSLASLIEDEQKFITSIVRGIIDNMANSNNGTKFIRKGTLDAINYDRLVNNERVVEVKSNEPINTIVQDGTFNQLPSDVYSMMSVIEQQSESLTGVSRFMQGIPGTEMKASSANFSAVMSQSQIRLLDMTVSLTNALRRMFYMWISMAMEYMSNEEIAQITGMYIPELKVKETKRIEAELGIDQLPPETYEKAMLMVIEEVNDIFNMKDLKYDVKMKVGTDGLKDIKINQINMLMQQAGALSQAGIVGPEIIRTLLADMMDAMDRPDLAKRVLDYKPQPNPLQEAMAQAELDNEQAEAAKSRALAENAMARSRNVDSKTSEGEQARAVNLEGKAIDNLSKASKIAQEDTKVQADAYAKIKGASNADRTNAQA